MKTLKNKKGFTLMEMLIVVAIIAVLVAIAIPVYNDRLHKARVAADWANVRAYYAEIQLDYMTSGAYNTEVPVFTNEPGYTTQTDHSTLPFLNGDTVKLQAGTYWAIWDDGYQLTYICNEAATHGHEHELTLL